MKTTIIENDNATFTITMEDVTVGKLMAIEKALIDYSEKSSVCKDVLTSFSKACEKKISNALDKIKNMV